MSFGSSQFDLIYRSVDQRFDARILDKVNNTLDVDV